MTWQLHQPVVSGLWDASYQVPQSYVCSGSSGGHEPDLLLLWEGLCSHSPCLEVHPLERCGKRDCQWRLRQKYCWVSPPSPCLLSPVCQSCSLGVGSIQVCSWSLLSKIFLAHLFVAFPHLWTVCFIHQYLISAMRTARCSAAKYHHKREINTGREQAFSDHHPCLSTNNSVYTTNKQRQDDGPGSRAQTSSRICLENTPTHWHGCEEFSDHIQSCIQFSAKRDFKYLFS